METILRVILRTDGDIHIVVANGQTVVCTLPALVDLLMNPRSFAAEGYSFYNTSTLYINPKNESIASVCGVTLLSATSDNKIICDFPHLFEILFSNMQAPANVPMYSSLEAFYQSISDEKELLLAVFLLLSKLRTSNLSLNRHMNLSDDSLIPIFKEIASAHLNDLPVKPTPNLAEPPSNQDATLQLVPFSEAKTTLVSIREYAEAKNVTYQNVLNWCNNGNLITAHKNESGKWRIDINDTPQKKRVSKKKPEFHRKPKVRTPDMPYEDVQKYGRAKNMMTEAVLKYIRTIDELMYYDSHNYHEVSWDGFNALIIDINPDYYCESLNMTNREIILAGGAPVSSDHNDESFVIHHIGQKQDSPFAIIPASEHRKFTAIFHQGSPDPDLHGPHFQVRKHAFWLRYLEERDKVRCYNQIPYLNPKAKQKHLYESLEANG